MSAPTTATAARPFRAPSPKAAGFWLKLRNEMIDLLVELARHNGGDPAASEATREAVTDISGLSATAVSSQIDAMLATNRSLKADVRRAQVATAQAAGTPTEQVTLVPDRLYEVDGVCYRTVESKGSGNLYAKVLETETGRWEYAPGAINRIRPEHRMTVERAKELSLRFARCIRCARELSVDVSVERGMGPVCVKKI